MALLANTFEGQADGTTITTGNSGGGSGDAFDSVNASGTREFDDGIVLRGSRALLLGSASGTTPFVLWNNSSWTAAATVYSRVYFRVSAIPTSGAATIMNFRRTNGSNTSPPCDVRLTTAGTLAIRVPATTRHTSTTTIAVDTWYRLEMRVEAATSTTVRARGRLFYGSNIEGLTPDEAWGNDTTYTAGDGAIGGLATGWISSPTTTSNMSIDDLSFSDVDWIGSSSPAPAPLDTPVVTVTDETGPSTIGGTNGSVTVTWSAITGATAYDAGIANGLSQTGGFTTVSSSATSPYTFTGLAAGNYTVAIKALPSPSDWGTANAVLANPANDMQPYWGALNAFGDLDIGITDGLGFSPLGTSPLGS